MTVHKTVGTATTLAREAVAVAASAARHPIGSAAVVAGYAKGVTQASFGLLRDVVAGEQPTGRRPGAPQDTPGDTNNDAPADTHAGGTEAPRIELGETPEEQAAAGSDSASPTRDDLPGPDIVGREVPEIDELPEPIVIEADDDAHQEAFHTEPKASSRESEHEGLPGDREEVEHYAEESVVPDEVPLDIETPVGTTGADVGDNPDTAESDLQQPATPPLLDESTAKAVASETETLRKAAEGPAE